MKRMNYLAMVLALALSMPATDMVAQHTGYRGGTTTGNPGGGRRPDSNPQRQPGNNRHDRPDNKHHDRPGNDRHDRPGNNRYDRPGNDRHDRPGNDRYDRPGNNRYDRTTATTDIRGILAIPGIQDVPAIQARQTITTDFIQRHRRHVHTDL